MRHFGWDLSIQTVYFLFVLNRSVTLKSVALSRLQLRINGPGLGFDTNNKITLIRFHLWTKQKKVITYFDSKFFPVFFNYFMKYYLKPPNCKHFKISSSRSTKWWDFLGSIIFNFLVVLKISKFYNFLQKLRFFWNYRKIKKNLKYDITPFCRTR